MASHYKTTDRRPAVAGQFYPVKNTELQNELDSLFAHAALRTQKDVRAIITPHAGYIFSGVVAASAFNQIDENAHYKRVFILASSHQYRFFGASIFCDGDYMMPYGKELVDTELGKELIENHPDIFTDEPSPHLQEHSIEVQLPFLHYKLKENYRIVPIILGTANFDTCKKIADVLKPYLNNENLFIVSTDFSHYPAYKDAKLIDSITAKAIISGDPNVLQKTLSSNRSKNIPNLQTSLCGWTSVLTLLHMTANNNNYQYKSIMYRNSGDTELYGNRKQVVGYYAITLSEKKNVKQDEFYISEIDKRNLLQEARRSIENLFFKSEIHALDSAQFSEVLKTNCGAFVTLHKDGKLRGCIGLISAQKPLIRTVQEMAVSAAIHDYRFPKVIENELDEIKIEISVLSPLKKIGNISEIKLGKHGVYIVQGRKSGVFLPQVATETGWNLENFLGHCARDKAGIGWEGWKTADIYTFTSTVFEE